MVICRVAYAAIVTTATWLVAGGYGVTSEPQALDMKLDRLAHRGFALLQGVAGA
jgi:hypothetical protein